MAIHVNDPGYQNGRVVVPNHFGGYDIELYRQDGDVKTVTQVIHAQPWIYTALLGVYIVINVLLSYVAVRYGELTTGLSWGMAVTIVQIAYFVCSWRTVTQQELVGLDFADHALGLRRPGLIFALYGLIKLKILPKTPPQVQFPGDPEMVFKRGDKEYFLLSEADREKLLLPIRILATAQQKADDVEDEILNMPLTIEVLPYVRFEIEQFWVFLVRIGTIAEATKQLRDSIERALGEVIGPLSPILIARNLAEINVQLREKLEKITEDWGIRIIEATMPPPDFGKDVNVALQKIVTQTAEGTGIKALALAEAEAARVTADAKRYTLEQEGEGEANADKASYLALAKGAKALKVGGEVLVDLEKARAFAQNPNTTIFIDGGSQGSASSLIGVGARLALGGEVARKDESST